MYDIDIRHNMNEKFKTTLIAQLKYKISVKNQEQFLLITTNTPPKQQGDFHAILMLSSKVKISILKNNVDKKLIFISDFQQSVDNFKIL